MHIAHKGLAEAADAGIDVRYTDALLKTGALQSAIFNSANFLCIGTDANGVIKLFNAGAERMLGYTAADVVNQITPADIADPQEVIARATALSTEFAIPITPGFEALVFTASRGIEDIYELTYIRKDGSRFPAVVSVTALRDAHDGLIGYLLIGTDNSARKQVEEACKRVERALQETNVELPAVAAPRLAVESSEDRTLVQPAADARRRTLLYVEDNPANMELIKQLIARQPNIQLMTAVNGTLGIEIARAIRPTAILMDINLPGIGGTKALKILREDPVTAHIPVVALSANAMPRDIEKGLGAGFFRYLTKPIKITECMAALNAALEFSEKAARQIA